MADSEAILDLIEGTCMIMMCEFFAYACVTACMAVSILFKDQLTYHKLVHKICEKHHSKELLSPMSDDTLMHNVASFLFF